MSTIYVPTPEVSLAHVLKNLPEGFRIADRHPAYTVPCACITDGTTTLWAFERDGRVRFERYGQNRVADYLAKLGEALGVTFRDEYDLPIHPGD